MKKKIEKNDLAVIINDNFQINKIESITIYDKNTDEVVFQFFEDIKNEEK